MTHDFDVLMVGSGLAPRRHGRHESRGLHFSRDYPDLLAHALPTVLVPRSG